MNLQNRYNLIYKRQEVLYKAYPDIDKLIEQELKICAQAFNNKVYNDYCLYENETYNELIKHEMIGKLLNATYIGIFWLLGNFRNKIREYSNVKIILGD